MQQVSKISFLPEERKIHIFKPPCNSFYYIRQGLLLFSTKITLVSIILFDFVRILHAF